MNFPDALTTNHIQLIEERGRLERQRLAGYGCRCWEPSAARPKRLWRTPLRETAQKVVARRCSIFSVKSLIY
jgi:hypothetical protein